MRKQLCRKCVLVSKELKRGLRALAAVKASCVLSCFTKSVSREVRPPLEYKIQFGDLQDKRDFDKLEQAQPRSSRCCVGGEAETAWFNLGERG